MEIPGTPFSYCGLGVVQDQKQIRLLKFLDDPCQHPEQIICTLEVVNWSPELQYAAISYVWGDAEARQPILINGFQFNTTENLYSALWHIRTNILLRNDNSRQAESLPLWVDAFSIDQDNIEERNHQVKFMSMIYGSASRVICWLGLVDNGNLSGDTTIAIIQAITDTVFHGGPDLDEDCLNDLLTARKGLTIPNVMSIDSLSQTVCELIRAMLACEFWKRVWIIQELVLPICADNLFFTCGRSFTSWIRLFQFFRIVKYLRETDCESFGLSRPDWLPLSLTYLQAFEIARLLQSMRQARVDGNKLDAVILPRLLTHYKATDPRDYVYGFDAVVDIGQDVDYSNSKKEVYMDWFKYVIDLGRVDLMAYAGIGLLGPGQSKWPSWLPDLASCHLLPSTNTLHAQCVTSSNQSAFVKATECIVDNLLHISGVRLGDAVERIFGLEPIVPQTDEGRTSILHFNCLSILANASDHHPSDVRPLQAFLLTLVDCFKQNRSTPSKYSLDENDSAVLLDFIIANHKSKPDLCDYVSTFGPHWADKGFERDSVLYDSLKEQLLGDCHRIWPLDSAQQNCMSRHDLLFRMDEGVRGYTAFQTKNGYIGIGPRKLKEGDEVCFLSRFKSPVLLREETERDTLVTKIVGACYMYGLSDLVVHEWVASGKADVERSSLH